MAAIWLAGMLLLLALVAGVVIPVIAGIVVATRTLAHGPPRR